MALTIGIDIGTTSTIGILIDSEGRTLALAEQPTELFSRPPRLGRGGPRAVVAQCLRRDRRSAGAVGPAGQRDRGGRRHRHAARRRAARRAWPPAPPQHPAERRPHRPRGRGAGGRGRRRRLRRSAPATASTSSWSRPSCAGSSGTSRRCSAASRPCSAPTTTSTGASPAMQALERNWALEAGFVDLASGRIAPELVALGHIEPAAAAAGPRLARGDRAGDAGRPPRPPASPPACRWSPAAPTTSRPPSSPASAQDGDLLIKFGGAGDILLATDRPRPDPRLFLDYHIVPGLFMPNGCMACSGALLNWIVRTFAGAEADAAAAAGETAAPAPRSPGRRSCRPAPTG